MKYEKFESPEDPKIKELMHEEALNATNDDIGLEIDLAHNAKVSELFGRDPSLMPDRIYRTEGDFPTKAFCFTGNGLYFSGTMSWSGYLEEWGVCHLSYPGWVDTDFVGKGVRAAIEGVKSTIEKHPELAKEKHLCFYGTITANGEFLTELE